MHHVLRRLTLALLSVALFATPAHAQTVGSVSQTTGITQSICRIGNGAGTAGRLWGVGSPAGKCGKPVNGLEVSVVDASALGDCSTGGGTYVTTCAYNSAASGANKWASPAPASGGGGGGTPGGSNSQVQFNNGGAFGATSNLSWNGTSLFIGGSTSGIKIDPDPSTAPAYYFSVTSDPASTRTILFDDAGASNQVVFKTATQTLTNKTIDAAVNTVSGIGSTQITDGQVALADMANLSASTLIGRDSGAGTGVPQALTVGGGIVFTGSGGISLGTVPYTPTTSTDWSTWTTAPSTMVQALDRLATQVKASIASIATKITAGAGAIVNADVSNGAAISGTKLANTPAGGIAATTVQAAVNELDTEKLNITEALDSTDVVLRDGTQGPTADIPFGNFKAQMNPTCANYTFTAGTTGTLSPGTISLYGHLLKVYLSSGAGNVITVNGCTSFTGTASGTVNTCSCDLAGGGDACVPLDGTSGSAGFIVPSPQNITITLVSSATNGSVDVCQF